MTSGRRDLPTGKTFGDVFKEIKSIVREKAHAWELAWKPVYDEFHNHFQIEIAKMQQKAN